MSSDGDIRVLLVLDVLLSLVFAGVVLWGLDFIGEAAFTARNPRCDESQLRLWHPTMDCSVVVARGK
ncbi:hypothetical protein BRC62_01745 [Halobacteriales archaeon QH_10_67_13]|nr:MAG: hypothetical protein BRC62_01745 [Halobacteriales archaeon QH_10_67_13]